MIRAGDSKPRALQQWRGNVGLGVGFWAGWGEGKIFHVQVPYRQRLCFLFQPFLLSRLCFHLRLPHVFIVPESIMINLLPSRKISALTMNQSHRPTYLLSTSPQRVNQNSFTENEKWIVNPSQEAARLFQSPNLDFR